MSRTAVLRAALMILALAGPARGQTPAAPPAETPAVVADTPADAEIEIIARLPGPALWRVATPKAELWIVGLAGPVSKHLKWDTRRLERALDGAQELVMPPGASINVIDAAGLLLDPAHHYHYPGAQTLRGALGPAERDRFEAAAKAVGQDPAHYDHWRPMVTVVALIADAQKAQALNLEGPQKLMMQLARARGVKVRRLANYPAGDFIKAFNTVPPDIQAACLSLVTQTIPSLPTLANDLGETWNKGNVQAVQAAQAKITSDRCFTMAPSIKALQDRRAKAWAKDLAATLQHPGKTVLAVDMDSLTQSGGLLDQLRADGLEVTGHAY